MSTHRPIDILLPRLEGVIGKGPQYSARCPAHVDKSPSLRIKEAEDGTILLHCMAGCSAVDVLAAIGFTLGDLFVKGKLGHFIPRKKQQHREHEAVYTLAGAANLTQRLREKDREIVELKKQLKLNEESRR